MQQASYWNSLLIIISLIAHKNRGIFYLNTALLRCQSHTSPLLLNFLICSLKMAPILGSLQQIPALQDNLIAIEPWHLQDMSVMERQRRETNKFVAEHQHDDLARTAKSLGKRGILEEEDLEWYVEDLLEDYISSHLVKRGTSP